MLGAGGRHRDAGHPGQDGERAVPSVPPWLSSPSTVLVLGLGNDALGDDGVGIHAIRALAGQALPAHVRTLEGGTAGWGIVGYLEGVDRLVLIDAMDMGRPPGTVVTVRPDELRRRHLPDRASLHGTSVLDALELAATLGLEPREVRIVGVQPAEIAWGFELSPALRRALPGVVQAALQAALSQPPNPGATGTASCPVASYQPERQLPQPRSLPEAHDPL